MSASVSNARGVGARLHEAVTAISRRRNVFGTGKDEGGAAEALVSLLYRAVLRREPDPHGLAKHAAALRHGRDIPWLIDQFIRSKEYAVLGEQMTLAGHYPLDRAPPMAIEGLGDAARLQHLWDHLSAVWTRYGETEPYWSVWTDDRFLADRMSDEGLEVFHATGEGEVERLNAWLRRNRLAAHPDMVCAEYGCGVGRVTRALARQFKKVIAFDISESHLGAARRQLAEDGIENVEFVHVKGPGELRRLRGVDLFYSVIVLQHNPPPIMVDILHHAFSGLNPLGLAFFQIPTYAVGYHYSPRSYRAKMAGMKEMEMHFLPQHVILDLAYKQKLSVSEIQPDWCAGNPGRWISDTFLLQKQAD